MFFSDYRLPALVAGAAVMVSAACGDSLGLPPASFANVVDTATLFALQGTPIAAPSGYDMVTLAPTRTELGEPFDLAFDIDQSGRALVYPSSALGIRTAAALQTTSQRFDQIDRAPVEGYQADSALVVRPGLVFIARSRAASTFCGFLGSLPRFGKFHVLSVDTGERSVTFELLVNVNCGYRALTPGLPTN